MDLLCFCSVLCLLCLCARLFICALWSSARKELTSWLSFVVSAVSLSLSHWYPGSGVVLDCIDSWSLHPYLLIVFSPSLKVLKYLYDQIRRTWNLSCSYISANMHENDKNNIWECEKQEKSLFYSIWVFMSKWNFLLSWVKHETSFITLGPGFMILKMFSVSFL